MPRHAVRPVAQPPRDPRGPRAPWRPCASPSSGPRSPSALAAAHAAQIVHRDVKPGNILITDDGTALITDFGISRAFGDTSLTSTGMLTGTPAYLAPEVARGASSTPASDVFSLGSTLYAAVEGTPPFGAGENPMALLHQVASGRINPPQLAGALSTVLEAMLDADPERRPTMQQTSEALSRLVAEGTTPTAGGGDRGPSTKVLPVATEGAIDGGRDGAWAGAAAGAAGALGCGGRPHRRAAERPAGARRGRGACRCRARAGAPAADLRLRTRPGRCLECPGPCPGRAADGATVPTRVSVARGPPRRPGQAAPPSGCRCWPAPSPSCSSRCGRCSAPATRGARSRRGPA